MPERPGDIGSFDRITHEKFNRKQERSTAIKKAVEKEKEKKQQNEFQKPTISNHKTDENSENDYTNDINNDEISEKERNPSMSQRKRKYRQPIPLKINPNKWSKKVCSVADKHKVSHRGLTEIVSAIVQTGGDINDLSLSRKTLRRHREKNRAEAATRFLKEQLLPIRCDDNDQLSWFVLHWDSKMLKPLEYAGKKQDVLAIILTSTHEKQDILLSIVQLQEGKGNAENETRRILQVLDELEINRNLMIGLVFDTTSVNTELHNGIVVRLEKQLGRQLLQLPCRHYIHELLCVAAVKLVYGDSKSLKEEAFASLIAS